MQQSSMSCRNQEQQSSSDIRMLFIQQLIDDVYLACSQDKNQYFVVSKQKQYQIIKEQVANINFYEILQLLVKIGKMNNSMQPIYYEFILLQLVQYAIEICVAKQIPYSQLYADLVFVDYKQKNFSIPESLLQKNSGKQPFFQSIYNNIYLTDQATLLIYYKAAHLQYGDDTNQLLADIKTQIQKQQKQYPIQKLEELFITLNIQEQIKSKQSNVNVLMDIQIHDSDDFKKFYDIDDQLDLIRQLQNLISFFTDVQGYKKQMQNCQNCYAQLMKNLYNAKSKKKVPQDLQQVQERSKIQLSNVEISDDQLSSSSKSMSATQKSDIQSSQISSIQYQECPSIDSENQSSDETNNTQNSTQKVKSELIIKEISLSDSIMEQIQELIRVRLTAGSVSSLDNRFLEFKALQKSQEWLNSRKIRLTASNYHKYIHSKETTMPKYAKTQLYGKSFSCKQTQYGIEKEDEARQKYMNLPENSKLNVVEYGMLAMPETPWLAASPDGVLFDKESNNIVGAIEIKCPYTAKDKSIEECVNAKGTHTFCLEKVNDKIQLKRKHQYYYQCQGVMMITQVKWIDFIVMSGKDLFIERIQIDQNFVDKMISNLNKFFFRFMALEVIQQKDQASIDQTTIKILSNNDYLILKEKLHLK